LDMLIMNCIYVMYYFYYFIIVPSTTPSVDPCYNYTSLDEPWRATDNYYYNNYYYYGMCDYNVDWNGWYRLFYNGQNAQMPESCVNQYMCGTYEPMWLNGSHPQLEDGVVTRQVCVSSWNGCRTFTSHPIRVKACPGNYYVYEFVKPYFCGAYCAGEHLVFYPPPVDPCYNYNVLDDPWRATYNQHSSQIMCDTWVSWNGWYRLFIQGQSVQMPDTCVDEYSCGTHAPLWLNGGHPTVEDGVVTRDVCGHWDNNCCYFQSNPIKVKACPGDYYVYEFVSPTYIIYCSIIYKSVFFVFILLESTTSSSDPCYDYNTRDEYWRDIRQSSYQYNGHDDTHVEWSGWYRLYLNGESAQMSEWCVSNTGCGGETGLYLSGSHPRVEDGVVTREVLGSYVWSSQCDDYRSTSIQVKACPGDYYVYKLAKPDVSIYMPSYCAVAFSSISSDPCYNYQYLDRPWRATNESGDWICDESFSWNGWYRPFYYGMNIQMSETCVSSYSCNTYYNLWLNGPHPQIEDGVVIREVCAGQSLPWKLLLTPFNMHFSNISITAPPVDPCYNYNVLDDPWRSTNNQHSSQIMCDTWVSWNGWYRLFIQGQSVQMPDTCVEEYSCGTHAPLWLDGGHPTVEDGVVTRDVCGHWNNDCCAFLSNPIKVKACPEDYYVYEFVSPTTCSLAYCADARNMNTTSTTVMPETTTETTAETTTTGNRNPCSELSCSEDERCGMKNGVYGCLCEKNHHRQRQRHDSFDFSETCESSSGSLSVSRCQLFEAGFPADLLHLNDPSCKGTVRNGRVEFHFDNDELICGTNLVANGTHFIYSNFILGTPRSEGLISREKILKLSFSCVYPQTQTLSMNAEINPLESIVHKTLPAGEGRYQVRMIPYEDDEFTRPFTGKVDAELDQKMNVEVRVEGVDSRQFASVMDTCWATPVNDPDYSLRWDLIVTECPNPNDDTVELLQNGVSTSSRFSFRMFIFTANSTKLYLHCAVHLCLLSSNHCSMDCNSEHHWRKRRSLDFHDSASISIGPLMLSEGNTDKWVPDQVKVSEASCLCASLMLLLVPLMSVLTLF
uniref:Uncharacterized LOC107595185 n=1 Tax=Sinocyclocheilus grahami TaxID=75366 RepID=A0A672QKQ0_SINGR